LKKINSRGYKLRGGPWIKIIKKCVELDFIDMEISKENALERALFYFELFFKDKNPAVFIENKEFWSNLLKAEDPREAFKNLTI